MQNAKCKIGKTRRFKYKLYENAKFQVTDMQRHSFLHFAF